MIYFGLVHRRRVIALFWKNVEPSLSEWKTKLIADPGLERLMFIVKGKRTEFTSVWESFMPFLTNEMDIN